MRPVTRSKAAARTNYNQLSRWYDLLAGSSEQKYRELGLQALAAQPGERVLEIGFGTGHSLLALAQAVGPQGQVTGVDISEGMLAQTQARLHAAGLATRVTLQLGDVAQLDFPAATFDAIFMSFTLELFDTPEIPLVVQRCYTWLKPGGRLSVVTLVKQPGLAVQIYEWCHDRWPVAVDCRPIVAQPFLHEAGFQLTQVQALRMWGLPVEIILGQKA